MTIQEIILTIVGSISIPTFIASITTVIKNFRNNKNFEILEHQVDRLADGTLDVKSFFEETIPAVKGLATDIKTDFETLRAEITNEVKETFNKEMTVLKSELKDVMALLHEQKLIMKDHVKKIMIGGDDVVHQIPDET